MPSTSPKSDSDAFTLDEYVNDVAGRKPFRMPNTRQPLSLSVASTGVQIGRVVQPISLRGGHTRASMQVTVTGSTKWIGRLKGSIDGVNWVPLGSVNTTVTSTAPVVVTSTQAAAYQMWRVDQVSMVTHAGGVSAKASVAAG